MRLHDYLDYHARETPNAEFAVQGERSLTYTEALAEADRIASAFVASGLAQGDRVAILSTNNIGALPGWAAGGCYGNGGLESGRVDVRH